MAKSVVKVGKAAGTRPTGARDEREAAARVREMFSRIAPRYDFLNHLLSFSQDQKWRRRTARRFSSILRHTQTRVLDLCCGTGDLAFAFNRVRLRAIRDPMAYRFPIVGSDFAEPMLARAREKARGQRRAVTFVAADALKLPFTDESFDLVASAFGFRNLANYEQGLREMARVLKKGGTAGILEFSMPRRGAMAVFYRFYFRRILPVIGGMISRSREAYSYLPDSVSRFPSADEISSLMEKCGFTGVRVFSWNFGSVVLHTAQRA
jgi:demethylmenaquinone methyltransferase / 2-methoxy-6-polyprenyl-1,4-benzoquinol methylase